MKFDLIATLNGQEFKMELDSGSEYFLEFLKKGFQEVLGDAASTATMPEALAPDIKRLKDEAKGLSDEAKKDVLAELRDLCWPTREKAVQERLEALKNGTYVFGGRGPSKDSASDTAILASWAVAQGFEWPMETTTKKLKSGKLKTIPVAFATGWYEFCEFYAKKNNKPFEEAMVAKLAEKALPVAKALHEQQVEAAKAKAIADKKAREAAKGVSLFD
jgi:hypothetical protein